jgi:glycosyltransferase involved in cell wall biosynthesis
MKTSSRYRILMVSNLCPPDYDGGYELRAHQVAAALRERGHVVDLVTSRYRAEFTGPKRDESWVHRIFEYVPVSNSKTVWRYVDRVPRRIACTVVARSNVPAMRAFLAGREYDIAYCFGLQRISLATVLPVVERNIPILWHAGDGYLADHLYAFRKNVTGYHAALSVLAAKWYRVERELIDYRNIAFVSEFLRDECAGKGLKPRNAFVISRGFEGQLQQDVERDRETPPVFFIACRIDPNKGIHVAVSAAGALQARRPDLQWKLHIAGGANSGYINDINKLIAAHRLAGRVEILGQLPRAEVLAKMRTASAFLSCAVYGEPFAGTIVEALASGTPLIGSNVGAIREVVEPGRSALVYEREDHEALSRHMESILVDKARALSLAQSGLQVVSARYTLEHILDQTERVFGKVIANHAPLRGHSFASTAYGAPQPQ